MQKSKKDYIRYVAVFGVLLAPMLLSIIVLALLSQPVTGDITRLGGYLESDFGWNAPQYGYVQPGFKMAANLNDYDKYYDIVVMGDSFSLNEISGWQNVVHEMTGLSIISFAQPNGFGPDGFSPETLINSRQFQEYPPRYFIYESVERKAVVHLTRYANYIREPKGRIGSLSGSDNPSIKALSGSRLRRVERSPSRGLEQRMQEAGNYMIKLIYRTLGDAGKTRIFSLTTENLFSNRCSNQLLVTDEDIEKQPITERDGQQVAIGLRNIADSAEKNGITKFMLLIFPDKLSTYKPYLNNPESATQSYIPILAHHYEFPRVDLVFQNALRRGVKDLYLPNDTHTGYIGHRIAAEEVVRFYFSDAEARSP